jgi:heptosyltransferase II
MKILIELPTWLGDTIMATPAIENLVKHFGDVEISLFGPKSSVEVLKDHPNVVKTFILEKNFRSLFRIISKFDQYYAFFSFRGSFRAKFLKLFISSKMKFQFNKNSYIKGHQVEKYNNFINESLNLNASALRLVLRSGDIGQKKIKKILGINPGASYGNAKRWYPRHFASVAKELADDYEIIIFGGNKEKNIANDIENYLIDNGIKNYKNLADKTNIEELVSQISKLDLFITGDSGPMHIAAAFNIPTVAIFGPTNDKETSQWGNKNSVIIKKEIQCRPCMKRVCPLKHHNCMKLIEASDVLAGVKKVI